jgi:hypothetical protein
MDLKIGYIVELKKPHACGSNLFEVTRVGADIKLKCTNCARVIMLDRVEANKRIKHIRKDG